MRIVGLSGGLDGVGENRFGVTPYAFHDAACVLLEDGEVTAGIEEERLNRIKHTNKCPIAALRFCLSAGGLTIEDVDAFAFGVREQYLDEVVAERYARTRTLGLQTGRQCLQQILEEAFGRRVDPERFHFVDHHFAHACSAYYPSGFDPALVFTTDAVGDGVSGAIYLGSDGRLQLLHEFGEQDSLGFFYCDATRHLGMDLFDEYKVMGLAPYGNADRFLPLFAATYDLLPDGTYRFDRDRLRNLWPQLPRHVSDGEFTQDDRDIAMAAQVTLERIVRHVLHYHQQLTGLEHLCLAGGVALNCTMNGGLLREGPFRRVFTQPAAHDGGLALGAALHVQHRLSVRPPSRQRVRHVYWGGDCGSPREIEALLDQWRSFVSFTREADPYGAAARLLSDGAIIGWARGRSEFGPRALGNRSILADPRPAANKDVINALVKKREAFRPFAPSVLEEYAAEYFELPQEELAFPFMVFTVPVRTEHRSTLGAITHVDGSARLQTVSRRDNPCYWRLIEAFRQRTGVPVLLNTSFNNYAEPIVETAADALVCFLTTGLHALLLDGWLVEKKPRTPDALLSLTLRLPAYAKLHDRRPPAQRPVQESVRARPWWRRLGSRAVLPPPAPSEAVCCAIGTTFNAREQVIPEPVFRLLRASDGYRTVEELMDRAGPADAGARSQCLDTLASLWERRLISLSASYR